MEKMIIGVTNGDVYSMPVSFLNNHSFYVGDKIMFESNSDGSITAYRV